MAFSFYTEEELKDPYIAQRQQELDSVPTVMVEPLRKFMGLKIETMYRYASDNIKECMNYYRMFTPRVNIQESDLFSVADNALRIIVEGGDYFQLGHSEEIGSVLVRIGRDDNLEDDGEAEEEDDKISVFDPRYCKAEWREMVGRTITGFSCVYEKEHVYKGGLHPWEEGFIVHLSGGEMIVFGDCIHNLSSNPAVFREKDLIDRELLSILRLL
jgi:hypothetical protein